MKIKSRPEDFVVREFLPEGLIKDEGALKVFALIKWGVTTDECLRFIAQEFKLKFSDIGYCGQKDKHAYTIQYVTLPCGEELTREKFKLRFVGYLDRHLQRGDHIGNRFIINVVASPEEQELMKKNESKVRGGFTNYFGSQRTGHELLNKSVVYFLLKGDYETALLRYYINKSKLAAKRLKHCYKQCFKFWPNLKKCYSLLKGVEKNITLRPLKESDFESAIRKIPKSELELLIAGYQALLWNVDPKPVLPEVKVPGFKSRKGKREVVVKPYNLKIHYGSEVILDFVLPKGSFATVLLDALVRKNL